jgi:hypothetical protein
MRCTIALRPLHCKVFREICEAIIVGTHENSLIEVKTETVVYQDDRKTTLWKGIWVV